jgi:hypothetical protein
MCDRPAQLGRLCIESSIATGVSVATFPIQQIGVTTYEAPSYPKVVVEAGWCGGQVLVHL